MKLSGEKIREILQKKGVSITKNRIRILECLTDDIHFHSISDIVNHTSLNTKSIYNNIKVLIANGLVDSYSFGGVSKYALHDNINDDYSVHLVHSQNNIHHATVSKSVFQEIEKSARNTGHKVKSIKIFVDVE